MSSVLVRMFGNDVKAVCEDGCVRFEQTSFISAIGKPRAQRIFKEMDIVFSFMGDEGVRWVVASGKEHLLCQVVMMDPAASPELKEYASAWISAYELLMERA